MTKVADMKKSAKSSGPILEKITPEIAEKILTMNTHNRSLRAGVVERYADAMKRGQWEINGETIKISETGVLLDGQHRLWAIIESGITIETYVVRDLPDQVFDTIDTGAKRQARDNLMLQGNKNPTVLSMAARLQLIHDRYGSVEFYGKAKSSAITNRDILDTVEKHPGLENSVNFIIKSSAKIKPYLSPAIASYLHYQFSKLDDSQAAYFLSKLANGDGLSIEDPILIARNRLSAIKVGTDRGRVESAAVAIKAWNLMRNSRTAKVIRWPNVPGEEFPKIK